MRQITCPVCFTPPKSVPKTIQLVRCVSCNLTWTYLSEDIDSESLYRDEVYAVVDNRKSIFEKVIFFEAQVILGKALKIHPKSKFLLDFGSGKGQFLAVAKGMDWSGIGIETEKARAEFAQEKYGVEVTCQFYESGSIGEIPADLITLNHVLEHLPEPLHLLGNLIKGNLAPDGLVYIEVPRSDSWQSKIAGEQWMHWDIPKHLTHWTESVLVNQMGNLGFSVVGKRGYSVHLGVLGMLQALLSRFGFRDNLILLLKRKRNLVMLLLIGTFLPVAWVLEVLSLGFGKSGILGLYFRRNTD